MNELTLFDETLPGQKMTQEDIMINILQNQKQVKEKVTMLESRVDFIEEKAPVHPTQLYRLNKQRRAKVMQFLGGKKSQAYNFVEVDDFGVKHRLSISVFKEMELDFKEAFMITSYAELPAGKLDEARAYISSWSPSTNTKRKINLINNQLSLALEN